MQHSKRLSTYAPKIFIILLLTFISFILVMQSTLNYWTNGMSGPDSSVFKYMALVISKGGMPYKDAFDHKGPLLYIINYIGQLISYYRGVWVIECLSMLTYIYPFLSLCSRHKTL